MQEDLREFYKEHNIEYHYDGIGNSSWSYKGITIAWYIDVEPYVTEVFCHWSVDKRSRCPRIVPVKKTNKKYYTPGGHSSEPWMDFEDHDKDIEKFKKALLTSIKLLEPRIQILKGKVTMINKHRDSKFSDYLCISKLDVEDYKKVFYKERLSYKIKLANGHVYPCDIVDECRYVIYDNDKYFYICGHYNNGNVVQLSKDALDKTFKFYNEFLLKF